MNPSFFRTIHKMSSENLQIGGLDSMYDLGDETFTLNKSLEAFPSAYGQALEFVQVDSQLEKLIGVDSSEHDPRTAPGPSSSNNLTLTKKCSWIREEENREENASSFNDPDSYSPQLTNPTKRRAKRPGTRRLNKNKLSTEKQPNTTEQPSVKGTPTPSCHGKEPSREPHSENLQTSRTIKDPTKESTSTSCTKDKVDNLRARFEHMSS